MQSAPSAKSKHIIAMNESDPTVPASRPTVKRVAFKNIAGKKFGKLTPIKLHSRGTQGWKWSCLCDCGKETVVLGKSMSSGDTKSCGCLAAPSKSVLGVPVKSLKEYHIWNGVLNRCHRDTNRAEPNYKDRGITVCEEWKNSFLKFYEDMGRCPEGYTLDREDNNGPYSKENCRWATPKQQSRNTRSNKIITIEGVTKCLVEWREHFGISKSCYQWRVRNGWDEIKALTTPSKPRDLDWVDLEDLEAKEG